MNVLDLFSGIGGFSLGLERAGMRTVAFCEIDPYCRAVLRKHWPGVPIFEDVRKLRREDIPEPVDLICGGFPCQPFSTAGKRLGAEDDRALWPEYRRLIQELRPSWVIGENVVGIVNLECDNVLADLEAMGYATRAFDIPACAVGAHHERRRIWFVAYSGGDGCEGGGTVGTSEQTSQGNDFWETAAGGSDGAGPGGGPWEFEPNVGRMAHGVPNRAHRLRALGNAVVPKIPEIIGKAILRTSGRIAA